jgi:hypothetical protein
MNPIGGAALVVSGTLSFGAGNPHLGVARLGFNGALDSTFSTDGMAALATGFDPIDVHSPVALAIDPTTSKIVLGTTNQP